MASASLLQQSLPSILKKNPGNGVREITLLDSNNLPVRHDIVEFGVIGSLGAGNTNPEIIGEFMVPTTYGGATGLQIVFGWCAPELTTGNVDWEVAFQRIKASTALNLITSNNWGTPTASAVAVPAAAGQLVYTTLAVAKANVGGGTNNTGGTPVAGEIVLYRLRRLNGNALDTAKGRVLVVGSIDIQDT